MAILRGGQPLQKGGASLDSDDGQFGLFFQNETSTIATDLVLVSAPGAEGTCNVASALLVKGSSARFQSSRRASTEQSPGRVPRRHEQPRGRPRTVVT